MSLQPPIKIKTDVFKGNVQYIPPRLTQIQQVALPVEALPLVRRVTEADLEFVIPNALEYMKKRNSKVNVEITVAYIRANMHNNQVRIVRTDSIFGVAELTRKFYEQFVSVEVTLVCKFADGKAAEDVAIYENFYDWAVSIGAKEFIYSGDNFDNKLDLVIKRFGSDKKIQQYIVRC